MSKRRLFFPLLEKILIRLGVVAESVALSKNAFRILIRAALGLVLLVHVLTVAASHLAILLSEGRHSLVGVLRPAGSPPTCCLARRSLGPAG